MKYLIALTMVALAEGACPNSCSGHGTCNAYDQCTCYMESAQNATEYKGLTNAAEWTGADCSLRTCARGISWTDIADSSVNSVVDGAPLDGSCDHAEEAECSDQGLCDRSTGTCSCFAGYEGSACQRTSCPNGCSGHGTCRSNEDFAYDFSIAKSTQTSGSNTLNSFFDEYIATYSGAWDSGMHMGCKCDAGYRGADCSLVECPSSTDPLDDTCGGGDITDYQLQFDAPVGTTAWHSVYSATQDDHHIDNVIYSCFGAQAGQDCSGRGTCDYTSGSCNCFSGYAGTACEAVEEMA
jgi:hypothetical protein